MTVTIHRGERQASTYLPVTRGYRFAAALIERGWTIPLCEQWNDKDDLVHIRIPKDKTDADLVADIEAAFPEEDFEIDFEDHYYGRD